MNLEITDIIAGTGAHAKAGDKVTVHYTGTLADGTVFDSSKTRGTPFSFTLGAGEVIQGWDTGVAGMQVGGTRKLVIPAELAYGSRAVGPIPPNSTLTFEVELLRVSEE
ncbi:MAG: FKBP-type peptidyl-prolyl cis-trans isomerase [Candidatus Liptonbacteria bacterium]|nr:FKBP-type peptidyl-prolyl cis-trans isomerase [Candidatus Liptonbacteria bacterium]